MWGIVPAAGVGSRIQPVGGRREATGERPALAVSDCVVDRMVAAGVTRVCFVIAAGDTGATGADGDLLAHHGAEAGGVPAVYVVQPRPAGICDAIFRALPLIRPEEQAIVGLPDALWFPEHALRALGALGEGGLSFLCFPVAEPERFESVVAGDDGEVREIRVRRADPGSRWIWGAFKLDGATLRALHDLWIERRREDTSVGALVNAWIERGGSARAARAGEVYVDVGTPSGHLEAARLLGQRP